MTSSYYDVVVLGGDLAPLTCAALLAKRGFRVLLLGQQGVRPDYTLGAYTLPRQPFTFAASRAPVARRILSELGLSQSFRRGAQTLDPAFQVALPGHRFDVPDDELAFEKEMEREFPEVRRPIVDFLRRVDRHARSTDALFERDLTLAPESLLERRELAHLVARLELGPAETSEQLLSELPETHAFRAAIMASVAFGSQADPSSISALQLARLLDGQLRGPLTIDGGLAALNDMLIEKIRSHSGHLRMRERASQILVRGAVTSGVRLFGSDEEIGCAHVIAGIHVSAATELLTDRDPFRQLFERYGEPQPRYYRYTLNVVVEAAGIPEGMKHNVYCVADEAAPMHSENMLHIERSSLTEREQLLCVEILLPARLVEARDGSLDDVRERILASLRLLLPFLDQHLVLVDSPHDGRKPWARDAARDIKVDPSHRCGPQTMRVVHAFPLSTAARICALPVKTKLRGLLLCNDQVAPGLGLEGQLIAASQAAHAIGRADKGREWLRRRLWAKVEF